MEAGSVLPHSDVCWLWGHGGAWAGTGHPACGAQYTKKREPWWFSRCSTAPWFILGVSDWGINPLERQRQRRWANSWLSSPPRARAAGTGEGAQPGGECARLLLPLSRRHIFSLDRSCGAYGSSVCSRLETETDPQRRLWGGGSWKGLEDTHCAESVPSRCRSCCNGAGCGKHPLN